MSEALNLLLVVVSLPLFGAALCVTLPVSYYRLRRKGYRPVGSVLAICFCWVAAIAAVAIWHPSPTSTNSAFLLFAAYFWFPLFVWVGAGILLIAVLPRKKARIFGERKPAFPFLLVGRALVGLPAVACSLAIILWIAGRTNLAEASVGLLFISLLVTLPIGQHLIRMGHRLKSAPTIQELLALDGRSPVLYLRSFIQEYQAFVVGRHARYGAYARSWHASVSQPEQNIAITLEEYLSPAINEKVGPFVALGGPEDYISPTGAMRVYCRDEEWMQQFSTLARQSACIIAQLGKSDNMRWEFDHLRREGLQEKLCIITRHSEKRMFWESLKGIPAVSWQQFSGELAQLGYDLGFAYPGPGSVIAFDAEGHGIVLTSRADLPEDFVKPILAWVINHQPPCQPVTK